jgi:Fe2+ or Zn2+ uptake regulation protein
MSASRANQPCEKSLVDEYRGTLHRVGLRATYSRLQIAHFLLQTTGPVTIGDVMRGVGSDQLDRVTVSRILRAFAHAGLVAVCSARGRELRFEVLRTLPGQKERSLQ